MGPEIDNLLLHSRVLHSKRTYRYDRCKVILEVYVTLDSARRWLILASLTACGLIFVFILISPLLGYPLEWSQTLRIIEVVVPVFLGYLGSAAHFVFGDQNDADRFPANGLLTLMVKGPVILFAVVSAAIFFSFGFANRSGAATGSGMSVDLLEGLLSAALGILAVTTNVAVAKLFGVQFSKKERDQDATS
jgi:hypothetical protein